MAAKKKPGWLTAFCIIAIVLGSLGVIVGLFGTVSSAFGEGLQRGVNNMQQQPPGAQGEAVKEMQEKTIALSRKWKLVTTAMAVLNLIVSGTLLFGGITALQLKPSGRSILFAAFVLCAVYEVVQAVPTYLIQRETLTLTEETFDKAFTAERQKQGGRNAAQAKQVQQTVQATMKAALYAAMCFGFAFVLVEVVLYVAGALYLRRPQIVALYQGSGGGSFADDDPYPDRKREYDDEYDEPDDEWA